MKKIAIISPNKNAYSETFIQAHKNLLSGEIDYIYGGNLPRSSEKHGSLKMFFLRNSIRHKLAKLLPVYLYNKLFYNKLTPLCFFEYYLKKNKPDVILAEYGTTAAECINPIKKLKIDLIVHFHGFDASVDFIIKENILQYQRFFGYSNHIIAVSNVMKQKIIGIGCPEHKVILNTYGPNNRFLKIEPHFEKKQFMAVGRFVDKKAPYYTILAFNKVVKENRDAKLIMAGDGPLKNMAVNLVRFLNLENNIHFAGVVTPDEFAKYLEESLAFVQHSITADNGDMEGTPVAILEASAAGLPVISTRHAGIPDVIIDGETGLLVNEHDVDMMANHMLKLIENEELARMMGKSGKKNIENNFSMEKHIGRIQSIIDKISL